VIIIEEMQGIAAKTDKKKRGDLASKELDPWLKLVQALGPTKKEWEMGGGDGVGTYRNLVPKTRV